MGSNPCQTSYFYQGKSLKPSLNPNGPKLDFFVFPRISPILDRLDRESLKMAQMASKTPRNEPHMLKTFEIFDFQQEIIG